MLKGKIGAVLLVALIAVGLMFMNLPYAEAHYGGHYGGGTGTGTATGSWYGGCYGGCHGGGTGTGTATGSWHGSGHGGGSHGGGWNDGHRWSYAGTVTASLADVLAQWSGFTADDILNVVQAYDLNVAQTINTVVLAKVAGIGLDEAAQIVADGNLATYLYDNGLIDAFRSARYEVMVMLGFGGGTGTDSGTGTTTASTATP